MRHKDQGHLIIKQYRHNSPESSVLLSETFKTSKETNTAKHYIRQYFLRHVKGKVSWESKAFFFSSKKKDRTMPEPINRMCS